MLIMKVFLKSRKKRHSSLDLYCPIIYKFSRKKIGPLLEQVMPYYKIVWFPNATDMPCMRIKLYYRKKDQYLPEVERIRQVTAPKPAFFAFTVIQYSSPIVNSLFLPSVILHLSACNVTEYKITWILLMFEPGNMMRW